MASFLNDIFLLKLLKFVDGFCNNCLNVVSDYKHLIEKRQSMSLKGYIDLSKLKHKKSLFATPTYDMTSVCVWVCVSDCSFVQQMIF